MVEIGRQLAACSYDSCPSSLLLLSYNPSDVRLFETYSAPSEAKDRSGSLLCRRFSTHTVETQAFRVAYHERKCETEPGLSKNLTTWNHTAKWSRFAAFLLPNSTFNVADKESCCLLFTAGWTRPPCLATVSSWRMAHHLSGNWTPLRYLWRNVIHRRLASILSKKVRQNYIQQDILMRKEI